MLFQITLNYYKENHIFYRYASSSNQAKKYAILELEKRAGLVKHSLTNYFSNTKNNWEVIPKG